MTTYTCGCRDTLLVDESQGINPTGFGNSLNDTLKDNRVKKKTNVIRRHPSKVDVPHEIDHRFGSERTA